VVFNNGEIEVSSNSTEKVKDLQKLGFDDWFQEHSESLTIEDFSLARITEVNKGNYKASDGRHEMLAELSGKMLYQVEGSLDYPTVGDWVVVQCFDDYTLAIVHQILPRKSLLKRKDPGKAVEFQLIAANIDFGFIMQSVDGNFNLNRLERYLVMLHEGKIHPIIVLSKIDLLSEHELSEILEQIRRLKDKYLVLSISNETGEGIDLLKGKLQAGKTYCLLGSSGVGKSTLLNTLLGEQFLQVNEVREKDHKGRHTTSRRQLVPLESGSIFIDTPGMRELANFAVDSGIAETFDEIAALSGQCRFKDCTHTHEKGCAVIAALEEGILDETQYQNYLKIQKESRFYSMSYIDKRKRDKEFGKMVKNLKKMMRKK
jgi:ribosome biogenesis GTPase